MVENLIDLYKPILKFEVNMDLKRKVLQLKKAKSLLDKYSGRRNSMYFKLKNMCKCILIEIKKHKEDLNYNREDIVGDLNRIYSKRIKPIIIVPDWNKFTNKELFIHLQNVKKNGCKF